MPKRIQRRRTKGWRLPAGAVCVTRPGKFGNPFSVVPAVKPGSIVGGGMGYRAVPTKEDAIECHRLYVLEKLQTDPHWLDELRGKDLACFCPAGEACHADTLIELANQ